MCQQRAKIDSVVVIAHVHLEIHGRTMRLMQGELKEECSSLHEALLELASSLSPTNLMYCKVAQSSYVVKGGHSTSDERHPHTNNHLKRYKAWRNNPRHDVMLVDLSLIHISEPTRRTLSRMPSSA